MFETATVLAARGGALDSLIDFVFEARLYVIVGIAIAGSIIAGYTFFKNKGNGGGLKGTITIALGTVIACAVVAILPGIAASIAGSAGDDTSKIGGNIDNGSALKGKLQG